MQIIEVKNNLVKINYDTSSENLLLSGFVTIKDVQQSFIGQIIHLEANPKENFAIVKLLFTFNDEGIITPYNGAIPDVKSLIDIVYPQELLGLLPKQTPLLLGELAQQQVPVNLDISMFENKTLICCEKEADSSLLINNLTLQLFQYNKKVLIFDYQGDCVCSKNKITASKDFKLPLNYDTINFIYNGLDNAAAETKALIQEVFLEVQNYVKTLPEGFIPFETFKNVVDSQYEELNIAELLLLKNKLLKFYEEGIFAQEKSEFASLEFSLEKNEPTIIDLSKIEDNIQREVINFTYSLIKNLDKEFYVFVRINDDNSDKKLLKQIYTAQNVYSAVICPYGYKYLKELKQLSKNLLLFAPIHPQNDFAGYGIFLSKLNAQEFIAYGKATQNIPLIVKPGKEIEPLSDEISNVQSEIQTEEDSSEVEIYPLPEEEEIAASEFSSEEAVKTQEELLDEAIKKDVDEIYTAKTEKITQEEPVTSVEQEDLTEEDLDFIEESSEPFETVEEPLEESLPEEETELEAPAFSEVLEQEAVEPEEVIQEEEISGESEEILPAEASAIPIVPVYPAEIEPQVESDILEQGDIVSHPKYGKGTVEKMISYGAKTLCSINFDNVGRRLLDPKLSELKKV